MPALLLRYRPMTKKFFSFAGILFLLALLSRLAVLGLWYKQGSGDHLSSDSSYHVAIARSLVKGEGFRADGVLTSRRVPVYPFLISLAMRAGAFPLALQLLQVVLGALSCGLLLWLARCYWQSPACEWAALF